MSYKYKTNIQKQKKAVKNSSSGMTPEICVNRMFGKRCKYCERVAKLYDSDSDDSKKLAGKCKARPLFYMNILDIENRKEGIQVYPCGIENWRTLIDFMPEDDGDEDGTDFTNPESCTPIIINRTGTGLGTSYSLKLAGKTVIIGKSTLSKLHPLHNILELIEDEEVSIWKPAEKRNKIIILPPWGKEADGDFYKEIFYHWNVSLLFSSDEDDDTDDSMGDDVPLFEDDNDDFEDNETTEQEEEETEEDLSDMDSEELLEFAKEKGLRVKKKDKSLSTKKLRKVIAFLLSEEQKDDDDTPF